MIKIIDFLHPTLEACARFNKALKDLQIQIHYNPTYTMGIKPSSLINIKMGTCMDYNNKNVYAMRSFGIPVTIDQIPGDHSWNVPIWKESVEDYQSTTQEPGIHIAEMKKWKRIPKVHRITYAKNRHSLAMQHGDEPIPPALSDICYQDVTEKYFKGATIKFKIKYKPPYKNKFVYLAVFLRGFKYIDWDKINYFGRATFKNMGDSMVYFPLYYVEGTNDIYPASYPVIVKNRATTQEVMQPDKQKLQTMVLYRKYSIKETHIQFLKWAVGCMFQGANRPDFSDAQTLYRIEKPPAMLLNTIAINPTKPFRYIRYSPKKKGMSVSVGEIELYESGNPAILQGKAIGSDGAGTPTEQQANYQKAFDGDLLTYSKGAWIGIDLGKPTHISTIKYITRNDANCIQKGDTYSLLYMDKDGWQNMGTVTATTDSLVYRNVPTHAVYLLKNRTRGNEEKIFTFENGKQVWW